jgi:hypothetical protein
MISKHINLYKEKTCKKYMSDEKQKDVEFLVRVKELEYLSETIERLQDLSDGNIEPLDNSEMAKMCRCRTDRETYETVFQAKLEHEPSRAGQLGYTSTGYHAIKEARIPEELKSRVSLIVLHKVAAHIRPPGKPGLDDIIVRPDKE